MPLAPSPADASAFTVQTQQRTQSKSPSIGELSIIQRSSTTVEVRGHDTAFPSFLGTSDTVYENPLITAASRSLISDIHTLTRRCCAVDVPRPLSLLHTLLRARPPNELCDDPWFKAVRIWAEVDDICETESFDGHKKSFVEYTLNILFFPDLHTRYRVPKILVLRRPPPSPADSQLYPFFEELKDRSSSYRVTSNTTLTFPTISAAILQHFGPYIDKSTPYGASNQQSSRLVPKSSIDPSHPSSITAVSEAIWKGLQIVNQPLGSGGGLFGNVPVIILGSFPAATSHLVNTTGANPGLYTAAWLVFYAASWTLGVDATTNAKVMSAIHDAVSPLTALGIKSSYQNEGDPFEADWQEAFFGYKYAELSSIKLKYDPQNFFTSWKGVASVTDLPAYQCFMNQQNKLLYQA